MSEHDLNPLNDRTGSPVPDGDAREEAGDRTELRDSLRDLANPRLDSVFGAGLSQLDRQVAAAVSEHFERDAAAVPRGRVGWLAPLRRAAAIGIVALLGVGVGIDRRPPGRSTPRTGGGVDDVAIAHVVADGPITVHDALAVSQILAATRGPIDVTRLPSAVRSRLDGDRDGRIDHADIARLLEQAVSLNGAER